MLSELGRAQSHDVGFQLFAHQTGLVSSLLLELVSNLLTLANRSTCKVQALSLALNTLPLASGMSVADRPTEHRITWYSSTPELLHVHAGGYTHCVPRIQQQHNYRALSLKEEQAMVVETGSCPSADSNPAPLELACLLYCTPLRTRAVMSLYAR